MRFRFFITFAAMLPGIALAQADRSVAPLVAIDWSIVTDPRAETLHGPSKFVLPDGLQPSLATESVDRIAVTTPNRHLTPGVQQIPVTAAPVVDGVGVRIVRYDVPLKDRGAHDMFARNGLRGTLVDVPDTRSEDSDVAEQTVRVVRYEVPSDQVLLHSDFDQRGLQGEIVEVPDDRSWKPEVRFLQPKARVFFDLKRDNDEQFDLFRNGSILASLDLLEIYKPLKFVTDYFAERDGRNATLHALGWRFGATMGLGITTALSDGGGVASGAPIGVASLGLRYEFPIGPAPPVLLDQHGRRITLDQRTRVGFSAGIQAGTSTDETITDRYDAGFYFGMLVNTPW